MRRVSPRLIALRAVDAVKVYLPFMLLQGGVAERLPPWLQLPWTILVLYYSATRVQVLLFDWLTTRYAISDEGISLQTGWPTRRVAQARWSEISALSVDQDLAHRLFGVSRARAVIGAEGREDLLLEALDPADVERLRARYARLRPAHSTIADASAPLAGGRTPGDGPGRRIYRATLRDKALISVTHGQFLLIVPFVLGAYNDLAEPLRLPTGTRLIDQAISGGPGILALAVGAAFVFGFVRASVRFHDFEVFRDGSRFVASGGLFHHQTREAHTERVVGVRLDQNPLMRLVGCSQLILVLHNTRGDFRSFVVLPVAPNSVAARLAAELLPPAPQEAAESRPTLRVSAAIIGSAATAALVFTVLGLPWLAASALALGIVSADRSWAVLSSEPRAGSLTHRRGFLATRRYRIRLAGVRSVTSWRLARRPRTCLAQVTVMDRRPVSLWAPALPTAAVDDLSGRVLTSHQGVCT